MAWSTAPSHGPQAPPASWPTTRRPSRAPPQGALPGQRPRPTPSHAVVRLVLRTGHPRRAALHPLTSPLQRALPAVLRPWTERPELALGWRQIAVLVRKPAASPCGPDSCQMVQLGRVEGLLGSPVLETAPAVTRSLAQRLWLSPRLSPLRSEPRTRPTARASHFQWRRQRRTRPLRLSLRLPVGWRIGAQSSPQTLVAGMPVRHVPSPPPVWEPAPAARYRRCRADARRGRPPSM